MILFIAGIVLLVLFVVFFLLTYKVIDPNEAHVIVFMGRGRKVYTPKEMPGTRMKTSYFYIPILMNRSILPLRNEKMGIEDISLNDSEVAPFKCDIITWLHISDPVQAAERLNLSQPFVSLQSDLEELVRATARSVSMQYEILSIMRDRESFSTAVSKSVGDVLKEWGVTLINLELNDIRDDQTKSSTVINDYEKIRRAQVQSMSRQEVAIRDREAVQVEAENAKAAKIAIEESQQASETRRVEKEKAIGIAEQEKAMDIAKQQKEANIQSVEALKELEVGKATVHKEAAIEVAFGEAEATKLKGEKEAEVISLKGKAEGEAIEATGTAEAIAKDKMADALAKFNEAATVIEKIRAMIEIEKFKYDALGKALSAADLKLVQSGEGGNIFGFPMNAQTGADLGQMLEGLDLSKIGGLLGKKKDVDQE